MANYGNLNFDSVCGHSPFVGISDEPIIVGGKFKTLKRVLIQGKILGNCGNSSSVTSKINSLLNGVKNDFLPITAGGFSAALARLDSIDINQPNPFGPADFTATFLAYPKDLSSFGYDVLDPIDNKSIIENQDGTISIVRRVSAKGISTGSSSGGIANARSFLNSLNILQIPKVFFETDGIKNANSNFGPRRIVETINRLDGSVSIDIEFTYRANATNPNILNYSVDVSYDDKNGIYIVNINGSLSGDLNSTPTQLRGELNKINFFNLALSTFKKLNGFNFLNSKEEQFSIDENNDNNSINFSYTYISDPLDTKKIINLEITYDYVTDVTNINISGTITARGPQKNRGALLNNALSSINFYSLALDFFNKYAKVKKILLNKNPVRKNITRRKFDETTDAIDFSVSFNNQFENDPNFTTFEYTLSANPSIEVYTPIQFEDGANGVFDLDFFRRGSISIQGSATSISNNLSEQVRNKARGKLIQFGGELDFKDFIITEDNVTSPTYFDNGYIYNFNISMNCETRIYK
jgi:hypothetical protein